MRLICQKIVFLLVKAEEKGYPKARRLKRPICWIKGHIKHHQTEVFYAYGDDTGISVMEELCLRCKRYKRQFTPFEGDI